MMRYVQMYLYGVYVEIKGRLNYRLEFAIDMFTMMIINFLTPLLTVLIYSNSGGIAGWSMYEVLLLQGVFLTVHGLSSSSFMGLIWRTINSMRNGQFDIYTLKPVHPIFNLIIYSYDSEDLGMVIGGLVITITSAIKIGVNNIMHVLGAMFLMLIGIMLFFFISLMASAFTIRYVQTWRLYEVIDVVNSFAQYPLSIYTKYIVAALTFVYPIAIVGFYPASVMLGRPVELVSLSIIVVVGLNIIAYQLWMGAFKNYSSAGG